MAMATDFVGRPKVGIICLIESKSVNVNGTNGYSCTRILRMKY